MMTIVFSLLLILEPGAAGRPASLRPPAPPAIDWPDFFASVTARGIVYSDRLRALDGQRVRLRGYSLVREEWKEGILMTRFRYVESDPHGADADLDVPFDAVGVTWRSGLAIPRVPERPTVDGTLRLGNHAVGSQKVAILLEDAVPVVSAQPR